MKDRPKHRKAQLNVRVSDECHDLVDLIANAYGHTKGSVVEVAIRKYAEELGLWQVPTKRERTRRAPRTV